MRVPRTRPSLAGLALAGLLSHGCHYRLEGDYDPFRCDPACSGGKVCYQGRCVSADSAVADGSRADAAADGPLADTVNPDVPDTGPADGPADADAPADTKPADTKPADGPADAGTPADTKPSDGPADGPVIWLDLGATDMPKPIIDGWPPHLGCQSHGECLDPTSPCCCPMPLLPEVWACLPMCLSPFCI